MEKLELKHIAPFYPYNLQGIWQTDDGKMNYYCTLYMISADELIWKPNIKDQQHVVRSNCKPILRPIFKTKNNQKNLHYISDQDLKQMFIDVFGSRDSIRVVRSKKRVVINWHNDNGFDIQREGQFVLFSNSSLQGTKEVFEWFYSKHYDLNRLIQKGLAIDEK